ncbi:MULTISPECIES: hypothetical protein [unclassified Mesorhizobium]|uniref:hypothetical protein n=1 Tax=unclassified Mesorhizobium TaxID=325217 RepID=UPI0015E2987E|nr:MULTISPECIES: hypothetical protein [unclassified Mesorhizobium]MCA0008717.1 hypothetical protein [Mesorhizobium sp. B264B1B]MCA0019405.1 hypothetical protein [Mesorhizobium sp. B264B1A]MCA0024554.1 hypothetical protein [Mesorhizobium sp. B263B1A]MCA0055774.1 hypothetical protein [Mesorhizobium sp. B261B1A]UCI16544.1 hypothetical protein FJ972_28730 [Mesorhizobium sp. B2-1-1]
MNMQFEIGMEDAINGCPSLVFSTEAASGPKAEKTWLPMLIAGLAPIVLGATAVMALV